MGNSPTFSKRSSHGRLSTTDDELLLSRASAETDPAAPMSLDENDNDAVVQRQGNSENIDPSGAEAHPDSKNDLDAQRPPLPPRPSLLQNTTRPSTPLSSPQRPSLQGKATTALSAVDIQTLSFPDGSRGTFPTPAGQSLSESRKDSRNESEDDNVSLMSYAPTVRANEDLASLLDEGPNLQSPAWKLLTTQGGATDAIEYEDTTLLNFEHEFDDLEEVDSKGGNEGWSIFLLSNPFLTCNPRRATHSVEIEI